MITSLKPNGDQRTIDRRQFTVVVVVVGIFMITATALGVSDPEGIGGIVFLVFLGGYFLHAFVHIGQSIIMSGYTPGVVTAISIVLPTSAYLYNVLIEQEIITIQRAVVTSFVGIVIFIPVVTAAHYIARKSNVWN